MTKNYLLKNIVNDLAYWKEQLGSEITELNLPIDYPRLPRSTFEVKTWSFTIPNNINQNIKSLSQQENVTSFMVIMTIFKILLHRYTSEEDIRVGTFVTQRSHPEKEPLIGLSSNTLVMRTQLQAEMTFRDALHEVRKVALEAYEHQSIPFTRLVSELSPERNRNNNPFFQLMLYYGELPSIEAPGPLIDEVDLSLKIIETHDELRCSLIYNKGIFEEETIIRMAGHFNYLLEGALANPNKQISLLPLLTEPERHQLLVEWNKTDVDYPRDSSIHQLFEEQVKLNPNSIALVFGNTEMTYHELDKRANQIANYLRELNIAHEQLVAICLNRSLDMIASFLGVLKAGGAYVPFDLSYPKERIAYMLGDSGVSFVISTESISKELPPIDSKVICLDKVAAAITTQPKKRIHFNCSAESLAYVMYTSGSTGKPKGVEMVHRGIVRLVKNNAYALVGPEETFLNRGSVAFDVSAFEIYGALLNGGKLVVMDSHKPTFEEIASTIKQNLVTTLRVGPGLLNFLLEDYSDDLGSLRQVYSGGEALPVWLAQKFLSKLKGCKLINAYGPTENAVNTTSYYVKEVLPNSTSIPIGRPISNDHVYILDNFLQPVPIGVIGELYMSGDGIARGYLHKPELTREKFPSNPFNDTLGRKLYRSGDFVRYRQDGNIEFIGRADDQVKIRGCRIELGEVETIVGLFPGVRQSVAGTIKGKSGTEELVAYVVMNKGVFFDQNELRSYVREKLPEFMIPTFFIELKEIPITPVGKIDRKRLPAPTVAGSNEHIVLPRNPIEEKLIQLWETLLEVKAIGVNDSYFELGGNSLLAMKMFSDIESTFNIRLPVSIIFQEDTIEKLARHIASNNFEKAMSSSLVTIQPSGSKPPLFCIHGGGGEVLVYRELALEMGNDQPVYGLRYTNEENDTNISVELLADKYIKELREIQPNGPFFLLGYCFGGAIAYEMAHKLLQRSQEVSLLSILNFANPKRKRIEINNDISYKKLILNNLKILSETPLNQRISFFIEKSRNALKLFNSKPVSPPADAKLSLKKAISTYKPKPYPGEVLLICADENNNPKEYLGWETTNDGSIHVHSVPTHHDNLLKEPNVKLVVKYLKEHLDLIYS
ncbi:MAG: amino acid adenylation domain-containing protein [Bacillus sp. (in: Bacteria)]|nr:amino acid adenylation domain-containing protein [Bacillus sp. (in: firmicutes)]